jgi:hypothetical protein
MNWKLILLLSLFGLAMGVATVFVIPSTIEPICWLAIFLVCAFIIARYWGQKPFLHGLMISIFNSFWIIAAHEIFFDSYLAAHPQEAAMPTMGVPQRGFMVIFGLMIGVASGLVLGLFAWVASKFVKPVAT